MPVLPTVRIVNPATPRSYVIINESDFVDGVHELWDAVPAAPANGAAELPYPAIVEDDGGGEQATADRLVEAATEAAGIARGELEPARVYPDESMLLCVVKGPRGRWYVKRGPMAPRGNVFLSAGLDSREEAEAALTAMQGEAMP